MSLSNLALNLKPAYSVTKTPPLLGIWFATYTHTDTQTHTILGRYVLKVVSSLQHYF